MLEKLLNSNLHIKLLAKNKSNIKKNTTMIFVPGLGTIGKTRSAIIKKILYPTKNLNLVTFWYKSHQGKKLENLEQDLTDLETTIETTAKLGIPKSQIGFISMCYGSYILAQHLEKNQKYKCALMLEPYLGKESLSPITQTAYTIGNNIAKSLKNIPLGPWKTGTRKYIDLNSFLKTLEPKTYPISNTPLTAIRTGYHDLFFNLKYTKDWIIKSGGKFIDFGNSKKESTKNLIALEAIKFIKKNT